MTPLSSKLAAALRLMVEAQSATPVTIPAQQARRAALAALAMTEARSEEIALPNCIVGTVHQTGAQLSQAPAGATLTLHFRDAAEVPHAAEICSDDGEEGAEIGLEWEGTLLVGYDGVFSLPVELCDELLKRGFKLDQYIDPRTP